MAHFLGFAVPGIPYGCTYALFAVGLVLTYQATGVFNFAFAAQAYTSAYFFMYLTQNGDLPTWAAFIVSVVLIAPLLGWLLDYFLFRRIPNTQVMAKVVTGISLLVGIPSLLTVAFGTQNLTAAPSILFNPGVVYFHLFGIEEVPINGIFLSTVVVTVVVLVALVILMRFTSLGLQMRAAVESRRLVQLDGVNATRVVGGAWMIASLLAGLAGVLLAPQFAVLQSQNYITLMVTAIAAAAWGVLRSMPIAAGVAVVLGVVELIAQGYLPTGGVLYDAVLPVLPMIVLVVALLFMPGMRTLENARDPLASVDPPAPPVSATLRSPKMDRIIKTGWWSLLAVFIISMLTWIPRTWENVFNQGIAFAVIFLSITLITGMGGQLSLAQATLAGVGAFTAGQLALHLGLNLLVGGIIGAVVAAAVAVVLALLSLRLKGLGLALMTLAAALVFSLAVFPRPSISETTNGIALQGNWIGLGIFNPDGHAFFVLGMIVLTVVTLGIVQIRKGTVGSYLSALRGSETAASGIGINPTRQRVMIFALSGAVAGIGGTLYSIQQTHVTPNVFSYQFSLVFVVVVITTGVSTVEGAIQAGIGLTLFEQIVTYLPGRFGGNSLVFVMFAFGALTYAAHPEGVLEFQRRRWTGRFDRLLFSAGGDSGAAPPGGPIRPIAAGAAEPAPGLGGASGG